MTLTTSPLQAPASQEIPKAAKRRNPVRFAILVGLVFRWGWVRNFWFRIIHLAMIGVVTLESLAGIACPLTTWEQSLRTLGGQESHEGGFIAFWMHRLIAEKGNCPSSCPASR